MTVFFLLDTKYVPYASFLYTCFTCFSLWV